MMGVGHWELLIIAFVVFLLFGHRFPRVMGSVGEGIRSFREGVSGSGSEHASDSTIHR
jgi:sec-independent protein translocase protein TatA